MSMTLPDFIHHAREKGMDHATIRVLLLSAGWREKDVAKALAEEGLDVPVPEPPGAGGAKEAFQYLLAFTALGFVVVNVVYLAFVFLDHWLPDPSTTYEPYLADYQQSAVRWSIAMLIVAYPLYVAFARWIGCDLQKNLDKSKSPIRRWLTYLALFAAAFIMTGDGIALVFGFLQGDLTTLFLLQILVILVVSITVFCYYLFSLRLPEQQLGEYLRRLDWTFGSLSVLLVSSALIVGFTMVESPFQARLRRLDHRRLSDLQEIESAIQRISVEFKSGNRRLKDPLPQNLDELGRFVSQEEHRRALNLSDPQTGKRYEYSVTGESTFQLCAEFALDDKSQGKWWNHSAGRHCFKIDILNNDRPYSY